MHTIRTLRCAIGTPRTSTCGCFGILSVPVTSMQIDASLLFHLSSSYWIHAARIASMLLPLDTCSLCWLQAVHIDDMCGVLQAERLDLCELGGGGVYVLHFLNVCMYTKLKCLTGRGCRGRQLLQVTRLCRCIMTRIRNMQPRWYTIGAADCLSSKCTRSCIHFCAHFSFGCRVLSSSSMSYILHSLVMYDVQFRVFVLFPNDSSNHLQCVCVHIVAVRL